MSLRTSIALGSMFVLMIGCRQSEFTVPQIRAGSEFEEFSRQTRELTEEPFLQFDAGVTLSDWQKLNVAKAALIFEGMANFDDSSYLTYMGLGRCRFVLGENQEAVEWLSKCIDRCKLDEQIGKQTAAEAHFLIARCYRQMGEWLKALPEATIATEMIPMSADYWSELASAELQLGMPENAVAHVKKALSLDPTHRYANQLDRLIKAAKKN